MNDQLLIFLHIPKCGGVTFHRILEKNFDKREVFSVDGQNPWNSVRTFLKKDASELKQIRLIKGHIPYGIHQFMPHEDYRYITFVRHPIKRLDSLFRYAKSHVNHSWHDLAQDSNFADFAMHSAIPDNFQTKLIAGVERYRLLDPCTEDTYRTALENIERDFSMVGILEKFEESLLRLRSQGMLQKIFFQKQNVTPLHTNYQDFCLEIKYPEICERHHWDYQLYTYSMARFDDHCIKPEHQRLMNSFKLNYFRVMNKALYSRLPGKIQHKVEKTLTWML
jgi:hypothetical protein